MTDEMGGKGARQVIDLPPPAALAAAIARLRQKSRIVLGASTAHDPAWDMLLFLFVAKAEGRSVGVDELVAAGGVPLATGLRYIDFLTREGWLLLLQDPERPKSATWVIAPGPADTLGKLLSSFGAEVRGADIPPKP